VKTDGHSNGPPNYTKRIVWACVGQLLLVVVLFVWNDFLPSWINHLVVAVVFLLPPLAYLTLFAKPSVRHAWLDLVQGSWALIVFALSAFNRLFRPSTVMKLGLLIASLKRIPTTSDEWITCCVLPFKICVVVTIPMIWIFEKIISCSSYFRPPGRVLRLSYEFFFEFYLVSLLGLLLGALLQVIFCRAGRATTTLRFFLFGFFLLFITMLFPRVI
jgi:hypothetical protein